VARCHFARTLNLQGAVGTTAGIANAILPQARPVSTAE
jgi:hypothetical protein